MSTEEKEMITVVIDNKEVEIAAPDAEEKYLEKLVFGDADGFANNLKNVDNLFDENDSDDASDRDGGFHFDSDSEPDEFLDTFANKQEYGFNDIDDNSDEDDEAQVEKLNDDELFFNDSDADPDAMDIDNDDGSNTSGSDEGSEDEDAWEDSDDERLVVDVNSADRLRKLRETEEERFIPGLDYINRLKKQYRSTFQVPEWATHAYDDDKIQNDSDNEDENGNGNENEEAKRKLFDKVGSSQRTTILASSNPLMDFLAQNQTYNITRDNSKLLNPEHLNIDRLVDANISKPSRSSIQSLSFHPTQPVLLTGGFDRTLRVYHIDGKHNNLITSLHLRQSPVQTCAFVRDPETGLTTILSGGRRKYMFKWSIDMGVIEKVTRMYGNENRQRSYEHFKTSKDGKFVALAGNSGWVNLLSIATSQWAHGFKIEGTLMDFEFTNNNTIIIINQAGEIWEFSTETYNVINRWTDITGIGITVIRVSPNGRYLAVGSNTGFVNVYDRLKDNRLIKSVSNLTTTISSIEFSHDSQVMCIASRAARDALRLVHLPSCSVFKNWPTSATPLGKVTSVAFSPSSGFLATGNEQGRVRLWRLLDL
jgi:U3 small nucleolar RNA-associated protein 18